MSVKLECQNCNHGWTYKGDSNYYATCPNCSYKVNIKKQQVAE